MSSAQAVAGDLLRAEALAAAVPEVPVDERTELTRQAIAAAQSGFAAGNCELADEHLVGVSRLAQLGPTVERSTAGEIARFVERLCDELPHQLEAANGDVPDEWIEFRPQVELMLARAAAQIAEWSHDPHALVERAVRLADAVTLDERRAPVDEAGGETIVFRRLGGMRVVEKTEYTALWAESLLTKAIVARCGRRTGFDRQVP